MFSAPADRNKEPIREVLSPELPATGVLLEIACGTLQHAIHIAPKHPGVIWQPTDINHDVIAHGSSIERPMNVHTPIYLDVLSDVWPVDQADVIYSANLMHISPPNVPTAVFRGAQRLNVSDVFIYGPFIVDGQPTAKGNLQFDEDLRRRNPEWGIRVLDVIEVTAATNGFQLAKSTQMPANNLFLHFRYND